MPLGTIRLSHAASASKPKMGGLIASCHMITNLHDTYMRFTSWHHAAHASWHCVAHLAKFQISRYTAMGCGL